MGRPSRDRPAPGIAAELARIKAALASAQDTIAWQREEIDRLTATNRPRQTDNGDPT